MTGGDQARAEGALRELLAKATISGRMRAAEQLHGEWYGLQDDYAAIGTAFEEADAALIVAAVNALPGLLDRLERVEALHRIALYGKNDVEQCAEDFQPWPCATVRALLPSPSPQQRETNTSQPHGLGEPKGERDAQNTREHPDHTRRAPQGADRGGVPAAGGVPDCDRSDSPRGGDRGLSDKAAGVAQVPVAGSPSPQQPEGHDHTRESEDQG